MFAYLCGKIVEKSPTELVLEVNGIGYLLHISLSTYQKLPKKGEGFKIFTIPYLREENLSLFGFATQEEKDLFSLLISVNGIGPKLGLTILSGITSERLKSAIASEDIPFLLTISGVGKKIAQRMVMELKDRLEVTEKVTYPLENEAVNALVSLGYKRNVSLKSVRAILSKEKKEMRIEEVVKRALQRI